jgi:FdhE protein
MSTLDSGIKDWVEQHPYLNEIACFYKIIADVTENVGNETVEGAASNWAQVAAEIKRGIPALKATATDGAIVAKAADLVVELVDALAAAKETLPAKLHNQCQNAQRLFQEKTEITERIVEQVIDTNRVQPEELRLADIDPGFAVFLAWNALSRVLRPLKKRVRELQKEYRWTKEYCPVCGQLPAMGQLVRTKKGRERELICGCCQMRWRYKRLGCPYCRNEDPETLKIIELAGVTNLRIDTCGKCKGYLKTYTAEGNEQVALADWSTLHLDIIGKNQGFKRMGYQLYEV